MNKQLDFEEIKESINTVKRILFYLPEQKQSKKTILSVFGKSYDENFINDYLAYVLNPNVNGIGIEPLKLFIRMAGRKNIDFSISSSITKENVNVYREYAFNNRKRIDILITISDEIVIGIECKIFSPESKNQTKEYTNAINNDFDQYESLMFFLTPDRDKAKSNRFISISYENVAKQLKRVKFDYRDDIRAKIIYDEFILHLEEHFMKIKNVNISDETKLYLENLEVIKRLEQSFERDSLSRFEIFEEKLKSFYSEKEWNFNLKSARHYQQIYKDHWKEKRLDVHIEFFVSKHNILTKRSFEFMIDVEGKKKESFYKLFKELYEENKVKYNNNGFKYRPKRRGVAIAFKMIQNEFLIDSKATERIEDELEKMEFVVDLVDTTLSRLNRN